MASEAVRGGDQPYDERVVVELVPVLRRVVAARIKDPHTAEDLVQETLTRLMSTSRRVDLDKLQVTTVMKDGRAAAAGWLVGDEIVSIDGVAVKSRIDISQELQKGGPKKTVLIMRGGKEVATVLDYSADPAEPRRAAAAEKKAKKDAEKAAEKAKKDTEKPAEPKKDPKG